MNKKDTDARENITSLTELIIVLMNFNVLIKTLGLLLVKNLKSLVSRHLRRVLMFWLLFAHMHENGFSFPSNSDPHNTYLNPNMFVWGLTALSAQIGYIMP